MGSSRGRGRPRKLVSPPPANNTTPTKDTGKVTDKGSIMKTTTVVATAIEDPETQIKEKIVAHQNGIDDDEKLPKKLLVNAIVGNRVQSNGKAIEFIAPKIVNGENEIEIEYDDIASE